MADGSSKVPGTMLQRFRDGDLDAFEALFREHQRPVYGWILRIVRNTAAAKTSRWRPSGASIARTTASSRSTRSGPGAAHRHTRGARLAEGSAGPRWS